ncbi:MAG: hypothetical protein RLZZ500_2415, partial [Bacteroidota bacterium]
SANGAGAVPGGLAGAYWGTTNPGSFTSSSPDGCLTFRFRSNGTTTAAGWVANVTCATPPPCPAPFSLTPTVVLGTSATFNWTAGGTETQWEIIAQPCGNAAPTATTVGTIVNTNTYTIQNLNGLTCYDVYVRAICTSPDVSTWTGPVSITTQVAPPACGGIYVDEGGLTANYNNNTNQTVTICPDTPTNVVTVTFTSFATEANWDGMYVFDGNSTTAPQIPSTNGPGNVPGGLAGSYWGTLTGAALPSFTSSTPGGCLTFQFISDGIINAAGWTANVVCQAPPACPSAAGLTVTGVTHNTAVFSWTSASTTPTSWNVIALTCGSPAPTATTTGFFTSNTTSYTFTTLSPDTCYDFYVQSVCPDGSTGWWIGPRSATTQIAPPACGGIFTDPAGASANYANSTNYTVTICPNLPTDVVTVTFTEFSTEANWDGLYVYDGSTTTSPQLASGNGAGFGQLTQPGSFWGNLTGANLPGPFTASSVGGCLTFQFISDGIINSTGWIANVTCDPAPPCPKPVALNVQQVTQSTAQLYWTEQGSATQWEIFIVPLGGLPPTPASIGIITSQMPYQLTNLPAGTAYTFYVRAICNALGETSSWSQPLTFGTLPVNDECSNASFAIVNQNLNCVQTTPGTLIGATASNPVVNCPPGVANDDVWYTFTATAPTHIVSFNNVTPANTDLDYAIFTGNNCGSLTQLNCNSADDLIPGTTYYIRIYSASANTQYVNFNLCIGTLPCTEAPAFCTGQTVTYANSTNVPSLGQIGCLFTSPNPAFFFLQVNQAGALSYLISQVDNNGTPRDVDYVAWGPFTDLNTACIGVPANPMAGQLPALTPAQGCNGTLHACSYSAAPQEIMCIPNAQLCEVYVIMITNFSNQAGTVTFTQTNTTGGTTACFPINIFNYDSTYYCQDGTDPTPVLAPGATAGTYTATPAGLVIDSVTGTIDLSASAPGAYVITATTATTIGGTCNTIPFITTTRTVIITAPANATIAYAQPSYCKNDFTNQLVTITGSTGGTFSASPAGLNLNSITGSFIPGASLPGSYTITYSIPAIGSCAAFQTTTQVVIDPATIPTFTQVAPICPGDTLADLPTTSNNGIIGTWSPALNNTATTTYTFTPASGICATTATMTIGVGSTTPTFTQVQPICAGAPLADLPTTSNNGVQGSWSPAMNNTATTTYTFTPDAGICAGQVTMTVVINPPTIVPTFSPVAPICIGDSLTALPSTSINGITGTWSPALDNTSTTTYTFTPDNGQCAVATTITIIVNPPLVVTVNNPTICAGSSATVTATPAIPGNYTYTWTVPAGFTDPGNVSTFTTSVAGTYTVVINQVTNFCNTDFESPVATGAFPNLVNENLVPCWDTTSADGIIEIWPPGFEGVNAYSGNQLIELNANTVGTLYQDFTVLPGTALTISFAHRGRQGNDVLGVEIGPVGGPYVSLGTFTDNTTWNLHTLNYVVPSTGGSNYSLRFVSISSTGGDPSIGNLLDAISISSLSCPSQPTSGVVTLTNQNTPTFTQIAPICQDQTAPALPTTSSEGITGTWSPNVISTTTVGVTQYTFTPDAGQCANNATMDITIYAPNITPTFTAIAPICQNGTAPTLPTTSDNGITGTWSGTVDTTTVGTQLINFTPDAGQCAVATSISVTINAPTTPSFNALAAVCQGSATVTIPTTSTNGVTGTWSPASFSTTNSGTFSSTFTPDAGQCAVGTTISITVHPTPDVLPILDVEACNSYTLPALTVGNYYTGQNGTGTQMNAGDVISATTTLYVYAQSGTTPNCTDQESFDITITPSPVFTIDGGCIGSVYVLEVMPVNFTATNATYVWTNSTGATVGTSATLNVVGAGIYNVTVTIPNGSGFCTDTQSFTANDVTCSIPKGISPNGDGLNDNFDLTGMNVRQLSIYNRYGTKVYSKSSYTDQWYGQSDNDNELPDGTYYYVIERDGVSDKSGWVYINREIK